MSSYRPYRPPIGLDKALREIGDNKGILYDPEAVSACIEVCSEEDFKFC
jgi:response regulator RpfG family c-di-GMP phosphodiesterase